MTIATGTRIGPYEIARWLGAGGMGEIYRARDPRLGREVAIKLIPETFATDASRGFSWRAISREDRPRQFLRPILRAEDERVSSGVFVNST